MKPDIDMAAACKTSTCLYAVTWHNSCLLEKKNREISKDVAIAESRHVFFAQVKPEEL
jgi:hypothetical protein